jgi:hypothetical protein
MFAMLFGGVLLLLTALLGSLPGVHSECSAPCIPGSEDIMKAKEHGTSHTPVQENLRWGCDGDTADRICNYNRHYAEYSGSWKTTSFLNDIKGKKHEYFNDSNSGKLLFMAPKDRTWDDWITESTAHGWPSFRDNEVNWDNVRVLPNGETVSVDGTHLVGVGSQFSLCAASFLQCLTYLYSSLALLLVRIYFGKPTHRVTICQTAKEIDIVSI